MLTIIKVVVSFTGMKAFQTVTLLGTCIASVAMAAPKESSISSGTSLGATVAKTTFDGGVGEAAIYLGDAIDGLLAAPNDRTLMKVATSCRTLESQIQRCVNFYGSKALDDTHSSLTKLLARALTATTASAVSGTAEKSDIEYAQRAIYLCQRLLPSKAHGR